MRRNYSRWDSNESSTFNLALHGKKLNIPLSRSNWRRE